LGSVSPLLLIYLPFLYFTFVSGRGTNIFHEIYRPIQNSRQQNVNMKHVRHCGPTNIRLHLTRISRQSEMVCGIYAFL